MSMEFSGKELKTTNGEFVRRFFQSVSDEKRRDIYINRRRFKKKKRSPRAQGKIYKYDHALGLRSGMHENKGNLGYWARADETELHAIGIVTERVTVALDFCV